jgi:lysophospholipase L1-like esterase
MGASFYGQEKNLVTEQDGPLLVAGDRVIFLGDSITQAGARPGGYVCLIREAVERALANQDIEVMAAGISGHRIPDCLERLQRDVLSWNPTWVVVYAGVNDVWLSTRGQGTTQGDFRESLQEIVTQCQDHGARVCLCTLGLIGEKTDGTNSFDPTLNEYSEVVREVADITDAHLVDLRAETFEHLRKINPEGRPHSVLTTDGVHLNALGNQFVASLFSRFFGLRGSECSGHQVLRHVVLFQFKSETSLATLSHLDDAFHALKTKIPEVMAIESGTNNSPEGMSQGLTHGYIVTFRSENDRAIYLPHPEHQKFVDLVKPHLEQALVFDFMASVEESEG